MAPTSDPSVEIEIQALSGLRAYACLGVLIGHCMFWVAGSAQDKMAVYKQLDAYPWMTGLMRMPEVFMDTFLVITGFLAARSLLPGLTAAQNGPAYVLRQASSLGDPAPADSAAADMVQFYVRSKAIFKIRACSRQWLGVQVLQGPLGTCGSLLVQHAGHCVLCSAASHLSRPHFQRC